MIATQCLSPQEISQFVLGKLDEHALEDVSRHVEQCDKCREATQSRETIADPLLRRLRGSAVGWEKSDADLAPALEQARRIMNTAVTSASHLETPARLRDYRLLAQLGEGGMGRVFRARHERLGRDVALKLLSPQQLGNRQAESRFEKEMRAIGQLQHPHIVAALDAGVADGTYYLAMELIDGCDGGELVRRLGSLPIADACELVRQAALGLHHAHEHGMVHRDVKPSNLLLDRQGVVKLADLGLAQLGEAAGDGERTPASQVLGTWDYIAPEQVDGCGASEKTDLYALGATLFTLLAGQTPFADSARQSPIRALLAHHQQPAPAVSALRADVPPPLNALVERLLSKDPAQRPASAGDLAKLLEEFTSGADLRKRVAEALDAQPPRSSQVIPLSHWQAQQRAGAAHGRWRPMLAAAVGLAVVATIGVCLAFVDEGDNAPQEPPATTAVANGPAARLEAEIEAAQRRQQQAAQSVGAELREQNSIGMELTLIPPGEFQMGSSAVEMKRSIAIEQQEVPDGFPIHYFIRKVEVEFPPHTVAITRPLLIGTHEVTVGQWAQFVADTKYQRQAQGAPDQFGPEGFGPHGSQPDNDQLPMSFVTWDDAVAFCNWLSAKEDRTYRLPTEAEWEYACRAGTTTRWFSGNEQGALRDYAWTLQNCGTPRRASEQNSADAAPRPIGGKKPNPWGLHDMTGNVWEWCGDHFRQDYYTYSPKENPPGPELLTSGPYNRTKVLRGGGVGFRENECRSASRWYLPPLSPRDYIGFRVVCEVSREARGESPVQEE